MRSTITRIVKPAESSKAPLAERPPTLPQEVRALAVVLKEEFDAPFRFYDAGTGSPIAVPGQEDAAVRAAPRERDAARELAAAGRPKVLLVPGGGYLIGFPLAQFGPSDVVALGMV